MGKGSSSSSQPQAQNVYTTTSNLPEYAAPYFQGLMQNAQASLNQPYIPYGYTQNEAGQVVRAVDPTTGQPVDAQRIAPRTEAQQQIQSNILGMQSPGQIGAASDYAKYVGLASLGAMRYDPAKFQAERVGGPQLNYYQMGGPDSFNQQGTAQEYMSPYMQQVVDTQKREAVRDAQIGQLQQNLGAARQGTYGGSRQLLAGMERERGLGQRLGDIQATGSQAAFQAAQQQFNTEQAARQAAQRANLEAALQTQGLGATTGMQAALANQQYGLEAQRLGEASRQFGAQQGLGALDRLTQSAQTLGNLGQMQQQGDLARYEAQQTAAAADQQEAQNYLDMRYNDFLTQRAYPMEQLNFYSSLLRGVPVQPGTTTSIYGQRPSTGQQLLGTGLNALSLYKMATGF